MPVPTVSNSASLEKFEVGGGAQTARSCNPSLRCGAAGIEKMSLFATRGLGVWWFHSPPGNLITGSVPPARPARRLAGSNKDNVDIA